MSEAMQFYYQTLFIALGIYFLVVLMLRPLVLWYFRIDESMRIKKANLFFQRKMYLQSGGELTKEQEDEFNILLTRNTWDTDGGPLVDPKETEKQ
jgi:hypothetical protein